MAAPKTKFEYYDHIKKKLSKFGFVVNPYKEIQYGLQFLVFLEKENAHIRLYESKKGLRLDLSQVKEEAFKQRLEKALGYVEPEQKQTIQTKEEQPDWDPVELIGVDESGKGDYFGPLVTAGCYVDAHTRVILKDLGVMDSKKMTDTRIREVAPLIRHHCKHALVIMGNESYNDLYQDVNNLNYILAWSHASVIESVLAQVSCKSALSDQFGKQTLVRNALQAKGIQINLVQRHKAESNIAVAAASVLAREAFLDQLDRMGKAYQMTFIKGASERVIKTAVQFCKTYGRAYLDSVAKIHFSTTQSVDEALKTK